MVREETANHNMQCRRVLVGFAENHKYECKPKFSGSKNHPTTTHHQIRCAEVKTQDPHSICALFKCICLCGKTSFCSLFSIKIYRIFGALCVHAIVPTEIPSSAQLLVSFSSNILCGYKMKFTKETQRTTNTGTWQATQSFISRK